MWCCKYHSLCTCWHRCKKSCPNPECLFQSAQCVQWAKRPSVAPAKVNLNSLESKLKACWAWNLAEPSPTSNIDHLWLSMRIYDHLSNISFICLGEPDSKLSPQRAPLAAGCRDLRVSSAPTRCKFRWPSMQHIPTPTRPPWFPWWMDQIKCTRIYQKLVILVHRGIAELLPELSWFRSNYSNPEKHCSLQPSELFGKPSQMSACNLICRNLLMCCWFPCARISSREWVQPKRLQWLQLAARLRRTVPNGAHMILTWSC
jgi:hypothetical protein